MLCAQNTPNNHRGPHSPEPRTNITENDDSLSCQQEPCLWRKEGTHDEEAGLVVPAPPVASLDALGRGASSRRMNPEITYSAIQDTGDLIFFVARFHAPSE